MRVLFLKRNLKRKVKKTLKGEESKKDKDNKKGKVK